MFSAEIGDRFEDLDSRVGNRVLRVIDKKETRSGVKYRTEVTVSELTPRTVGRKRWVKAHTLATGFRKVSR